MYAYLIILESYDGDSRHITRTAGSLEEAWGIWFEGGWFIVDVKPI